MCDATWIRDMDYEDFIEDTKKIEAFEMWMWMWRWIERISWGDHVRNEEVLRRVGEKRSMIYTIIRERQRRWMGHTLRGGSILRTAMEGNWRGKEREEDQGKS